MNTVIEVNQGLFKDNVLVTKENLDEVIAFANKHSWKYIIKGDVLIPNTYRILDVKRKVEIDKQCPWDHIKTSYKSCDIAIKRDGWISYIELPMKERHITNTKILELTRGLTKI